MHGCTQEAKNRAAVETLPVEHHSPDVPSGSLGVDRVGQLHSSASAWRLSTLNLENIRCQDVAPD
jgi:hypothetical protein